MKADETLDFTHSLAGSYIRKFAYPWQALDGIKELIIALGKQLGAEYIEVSPLVWVHKGAKTAQTAYLGAPCIIGEGTEVRHCAFIRGGALIGKNCVVGNSVEVKNSIFFDGAQAPHFNYAGDSILGYKSHLGAGAVTSNLKSDKSPVKVDWGGDMVQTNLKKLGAIVGDFAEIGCNSVLNPGTVIGRNSTVYPLSCVRGYVPPDSIFKTSKIIVKKRS